MKKAVPPAVAAANRAKFGLDQPLPVQFLTYLGNVARLDFGVDFDQGRPVSRMLAETVPNTVRLALVAIVIDLAVGIALGSALQVALFVAPVLVFASYLRPEGPMDLLFTNLEVLAIVLAASVMALVSQDGESNWMEGVQMLAVYIILGIVFYYLPMPGGEAVAAPAH